jgi:hypothetical protein
MKKSCHYTDFKHPTPRGEPNSYVPFCSTGVVLTAKTIHALPASNEHCEDCLALQKGNLTLLALLNVCTIPDGGQDVCSL